jgi:hypothetical protein
MSNNTEGQPPGTLIAKIEVIGQAMDEGLFTPNEAAHTLAEASNGGLTHFGALDLLGDWRTARARYAAVFDRLARDE